MIDNPFSPPKAPVSDVGPEMAGTSPRPLWNPRAAVYWSLLLSPAFGAYLHMKNWQALDQPAKATAAKIWFVSIVVILFAAMCWGAVRPDTSLDGISRFFGFFLLLAWYHGSGRFQTSYVKTRFGKAYPRRSWLAALGGAVVAICLAMGVVLVLLVLSTRVLHLTVPTE